MTSIVPCSYRAETVTFRRKRSSPDTPRPIVEPQNVLQETQNRPVLRHFFPISMDVQAVVKQRAQEGYRPTMKRVARMHRFPSDVTVDEVREAHEEECRQEQQRNAEIREVVKDYFEQRSHAAEEARKSKEQEDFYREIDRYFHQPKPPQRVEHIARVVYTKAPPLTKEEEKAAKCCVIL